MDTSDKGRAAHITYNNSKYKLNELPMRSLNTTRVSQITPL